MKRVAIQIDPADNVVTLVEDAAGGDSVEFITPDGSRQVTVLDDVPFGHKVAVEEIPACQKVVKYNETIGRASRAISRGRHVHVHNVQSGVQGGME